MRGSGVPAAIRLTITAAGTPLPRKIASVQTQFFRRVERDMPDSVRHPEAIEMKGSRLLPK